MSDPIERLNSLGDTTEGAPMPRPAAEIRARGDQIRRRRRALVAGSAAAAVAAVAVPAVALTSGSGGEPALAPSPTASDPVPAAALGADNLVTSEDAVYTPGGTVDWVERDTFQGDGQAAFSPCAESSMTGLGADTVYQRDFDFVVLSTQAVDPVQRLNEVVSEFPTAAEAEAAYEEIQSWYGDCMPPGADRFEAGAFEPVPLGVDGEAAAQLSTYGPVEKSVDPTGDLGYFLETGVVLAGDRVAVLTQVVVGQDYNFPVSDRPVVRMLPVAAERLVLGGSEGTTGTTGPAQAGEVPDDFPLDLAVGDPPVPDSDTTVDGPAPDAWGAGRENACGAELALPDAGRADVGSSRPGKRLGYSISTVEGYDGRTLRAYPTVQDALDRMSMLRSQLQGCARDDDAELISARMWRSFSSDTGYDSVTFGWHYEPTEFQPATAGGLYTVVRVGNAVLALQWSGEYDADVQAALAPDQVELARLIAAEMCVFAEAGC